MASRSSYRERRLQMDVRPDAWFTVLRVDGMHYSAACRNLANAEKQFAKVEQARAHVEETQALIDRLLEQQTETGRSQGERIEQLAIRIESEESELAAAYAPYLEALASVHILSASSLEAHINDLAEPRMCGKAWAEFERLSLEAKWLFFPRIVGCSDLDPGHDALQGLSRLVTRRNRLVHYKPRREYWQPPGIPSFLEELGLSVDSGRDSVATVHRLIEALANRLGEGAPRWFRMDGALGFFEIRSEGRTA